MSAAQRRSGRQRKKAEKARRSTAAAAIGSRATRAGRGNRTTRSSNVARRPMRIALLPKLPVMLLQQERLLAEKAKAEAEAAQRAAMEQQQLLAKQAEAARLAASEADRARLTAEQDKEKLRQQLLQQFNLILETRDTARGLIVNMSDVLFDTGEVHAAASRTREARASGWHCALSPWPENRSGRPHRQRRQR